MAQSFIALMTWQPSNLPKETLKRSLMLMQLITQVTTVFCQTTAPDAMYSKIVTCLLVLSHQEHFETAGVPAAS
jgi:hypothetical protein